MSSSSLHRRLSALACTGALTVGSVAAASPASAGDLSFSKSSGRMASAEWLEIGTLPGGVAGNIHFGSMEIQEASAGRANVYGIVVDLQCEGGVVPSGPGGGHGEPLPEGCTAAGTRFIKGGDVTFAMDRKLSKATLTGTLDVVGHDGGPSGQPPVKMTLTGVGSSFSSQERGVYAEGGTRYTYSYSFTGRAAQVTGSIGAMVFDDVAGERSSAQLGAYRSLTRTRQR